VFTEAASGVTAALRSGNVVDGERGVAPTAPAKTKGVMNVRPNAGRKAERAARRNRAARETRSVAPPPVGTRSPLISAR
jgi:hypothetical protein